MVLLAFVERFSRWLRVDFRHIDRAEAMFTRWGVGLVMFGRILPGVRTLVSVPAGMTRMNFGQFFAAAFSGAYVWNTLLVAVGYLLWIQYRAVWDFDFVVRCHPEHIRFVQCKLREESLLSTRDA